MSEGNRSMSEANRVPEDLHEQLVALALGELDGDQARRIRGVLADDPAAAAEFAEISAHFALHDELDELAPPPELWNRIRGEIDRTAPRSFFERAWMPVAAAALIALAFVVPKSEGDPAMTTLFGELASSDGKTFTTSAVARISVAGGPRTGAGGPRSGDLANGDGESTLADVVPAAVATVTIDANTRFSLPESKRLALGAGRVYLDISKSSPSGERADRTSGVEHGGGPAFTVDAGPVRVITTGTAYLVERRNGAIAVCVVRGSVRCEWDGGQRDVVAGELFSWPARTCTSAKPGRATAWFTTPALRARVVDETSVEVVVQNRTPDALVLAAPADGEPLFYASYANRQVPLDPVSTNSAGVSILDGPIQLQPGSERVFLLRLPHPLPEREALFISYPGRGVRVRADRARDK